MNLFENGRQASGQFASLYGKSTLGTVTRYDELIGWFKKSYGKNSCGICSSSGRVELIGNHTDHNGGKVLGCTVNLDILAAFAPTTDGVVTLKSKGYSDIVFDMSQLEAVEYGSKGMAKGVLRYLRDGGFSVGGFSACVTASVPGGAGLSSSAAYQLLIGQIVNALYNDGAIPSETLARAGQYAENVYFKKPCGLLDQGVIAVGGVVAMDFKDGFNYVKVPVTLADFSLVVVDTGGSHANLTEHYAAIPAEMKAVAQYFGSKRLVDVDVQKFNIRYAEIVQNVGLRPALRAKHFFEETARVEQAQAALLKGDDKEFLRLVRESGNSSVVQLQNCSANGDAAILDALKLASEICPDGACRVHGGGFAGTILCVVPKLQAEEFAAKMAEKYGVGKVHSLKVRSVGATVL